MSPVIVLPWSPRVSASVRVVDVCAAGDRGAVAVIAIPGGRRGGDDDACADGDCGGVAANLVVVTVAARAADVDADGDRSADAVTSTPGGLCGGDGDVDRGAAAANDVTVAAASAHASASRRLRIDSSIRSCDLRAAAKIASCSQSSALTRSRRFCHELPLSAASRRRFHSSSISGTGSHSTRSTRCRLVLSSTVASQPTSPTPPPIGPSSPSSAAPHTPTPTHPHTPTHTPTPPSAPSPRSHTG